MIIVQKDVKYINTVNDEPLTAVPFDDCSCEVFFDIYDESTSLLDPNIITKMRLIGEVEDRDIGFDEAPEAGDYFIYVGPEHNLSSHPNSTKIHIIDKTSNVLEYDVILSYNSSTSKVIKNGDLIVFSEKVNGRISRIDLISYNESVIPMVPRRAYIYEYNENNPVESNNSGKGKFKFISSKVKKGIETISSLYTQTGIFFGEENLEVPFYFKSDFDGKVLRTFTISNGEKTYTTKDDCFFPISVVSNIPTDDPNLLGLSTKSDFRFSSSTEGVTVIFEPLKTKEISVKVYPVYDGLEYNEFTEIKFIHWGVVSVIPDYLVYVLIYSEKALFEFVGNNGLGEVSAYVEWPTGERRDLPKDDQGRFILIDENVGDPGDYKAYFTLSHTDNYSETVESVIKIDKAEDIDTDRLEETTPRYYFQIEIKYKKEEE